MQTETYRQAKESVRLRSSYDENYSANFHVWIQDQKVGHHRHEILRYLETVYSDVGSVFSFYPRQLTRVSLLSTTDFQGLAQLPEKVIGVSSGISHEIQIPLARVHNLEDPRQLKNTLYHEYTHQVIRLLTANHPSVPGWFHEGVASHLEPYRNTRHERSLLLKLLASGELADKSSFQGPLYKHSNSSDLYIQAGSVIAFLEERELLIPLLQNLQNLRNNRDFKVLLIEFTGWTITELFDKWKGWISEKSRSSLARGR
ncbi:hypothetical protein HOF92_06500 [bacterium]|nr:hypothetical protein [bacterium]